MGAGVGKEVNGKVSGIIVVRVCQPVFQNLPH